MLRSLALAGVCVMLAGFALSSPVPPLSLSERLAAPGGTSPLVPTERIRARLTTDTDLRFELRRQGVIRGLGTALDPVRAPQERSGDIGGRPLRKGVRSTGSMGMTRQPTP